MSSAGAHNAYIWLKKDYFLSPAASGCADESNHNSMRYLRAALFLTTIITLGLCITNFFLMPLQLLALCVVKLRLRRSGERIVWPRVVLRASEYATGAWQGLTATLLEAFGMRVGTYGDVLTDDQIGEGALILSNHPSTADWVYLWSWIIRFGDLSRLKIVLKASLHRAPVMGWALQCCRYLFLQRDWEKDRAHMAEIVDHWSRSGGCDTGATDTSSSVQLLIFPEGTDMRPISYDQSCAFAERKENRGKLVQFQHVLQPRVTGFIHVIKLLRKAGSVKAVYDITSDTIARAAHREPASGRKSCGSSSLALSFFAPFSLLPQSRQLSSSRHDREPRPRRPSIWRALSSAPIRPRRSADE